MTYSDLIILIPSHSLEDFPTELGEKEAASLLNAFSVAWHPLLLKSAGATPTWHRADEPPETLAGRLIFVPATCETWVPAGWIDRARSEGAVVVVGLSEREEMIRAAVDPLESTTELDPNLVADFLALGSCNLQMELLTRHMHHFSNLDEVHLQREAVAAAAAAVANDATGAREHLRTCFETLTEARERFYPVDCYLIDLCLLIPRLADDHLQRLLIDTKGVNILVTGKDLEEIETARPEITRLMREAWERESADLVGGEYGEPPSPLLPVESYLWDFDRGRDVFRRMMNRVPTTWGRRRFGLTTLLPQILNRYGYHSALHVVLDDGIYPDAEQSKIRWEGCDGTVLDAMTRIPLAGDSPASFLRFPMRMAESMEEDQVAAIIFARWPEVKSPWLEDFRRMQSYSPTLGRFVTFNDFFQHTDTPGRMSSFNAKEYLTPYLTQSVARREADPIGRYVGHFLRRQQFEAGRWCRSLAAVLTGRPVGDTIGADAERAIEQGGPEGQADAVEHAGQFIGTFVADAARELADVVMSGASGGGGFLLFNPCSFTRRVAVDLPELAAAPEVAGPVKGVQFDGGRKTVVAEIPGAGFAWIPVVRETTAAESKSEVPTAEENMIRNEFFEVHINPETGGIQRLKGYGRSPNRLSQQIAFRFPRERVFTIGEGEEAEEVKSWYSEMRCHSTEITCDGPMLGEIVSRGEIVDQKGDKRLAAFVQTVRVWRGKPVVEIDIELEIDRMPEGDPWSNFFAVRWAWNDSAASLTRSLLGGAQQIGMERFESPHYIEIATESQRTTILTMGLPFHRSTGPRMIDSLLVTEGETRRRFGFAIAVDEDYPMQAAIDAMTPVPIAKTDAGPPQVGNSGWLFHVSARNVQLTRIMELTPQPPKDLPAWEKYDYEPLPPGEGFAVRLVETEGRHRTVKLRCFRTPSKARQRDFQGRTVTDLAIVEDAVIVDMTAHEIADIELRFGEEREQGVGSRE